jgi:hypothetical protein
VIFIIIPGPKERGISVKTTFFFDENRKASILQD